VDIATTSNATEVWLRKENLCDIRIKVVLFFIKIRSYKTLYQQKSFGLFGHLG
jgi:hypothetical protein